LVRLKKCGQFLFVQQLGQLGDIDSNPPRLVFGEQLAAVSTGNRMDQIVLYKGFRIRAYQEWSGLWLAETNKPVRRRPGAAITTTPILSTLPRPPVTQRQRPPLLS
jgi:hypothetical protein